MSAGSRPLEEDGQMWRWRARMLISDLKAPNCLKRCSAAKKLGAAREPAALEPLIAALQDEYVAQDAAIALAKIGDPRAIEPLYHRLRRMKYGVQPAGASTLDQSIGPATGQA